MSNTKKKSRAKLIFINIVVLAGILFSLELAIRIIYPGLQPMGQDKSLYVRSNDNYGYKPLSSGYAMGAWFEIDAKGHRKSSLYSDNEKKILVVGDSVSVGVGVESEKVYPALLDKMLDTYSITNASVSGYSYKDYAKDLEDELSAEKYVGVLVGLVLNDYSSLSQAGIVNKLEERGQNWEDYKTAYPNVIVRSLRYFNDNYFDFNRYLKQHYFTSLWIKSLITDTQKNYYKHDLHFYKQDGAVKSLTTEILQLKSIAEAHGLWVKFMVFPYEYQLRKESLDFSPQDKILAAGKAANAQMYDFTKLFEEHEAPSDLFLYLDPMHFSNKGHDLVAQEIRDNVLEDLQ